MAEINTDISCFREMNNSLLPALVSRNPPIVIDVKLKFALKIALVFAVKVLKWPGSKSSQILT